MFKADIEANNETLTRENGGKKVREIGGARSDVSNSPRLLN